MPCVLTWEALQVANDTPADRILLPVVELVVVLLGNGCVLACRKEEAGLEPHQEWLQYHEAKQRRLPRTK